MNADALLDRMRYSPQDWRIADIETVCRGFGIDCSPPRAGSHYKIKHPAMQQILTIPAHRPIRAVYIRELVKFVDAFREQR